MLSHAHLHVLLNWVYALVMGGYCLLVLVLSVLWARMKTVLKPNTIISTVTITVLLPVRNEEDSIVACLQSIAEQDFPADRLEVLVLDDDSTDRTAELVAKFIQSRTTAMHIQLIHLPPVPGLTAHKKRALDIGVQTARGELIVTTDGDCVSGPHWLSTLAAFYEAQKPKLIAGPVAIEPGNTLFGKMQALEFSGLMAVGGASAAAGVPLLCNGANLAYPRAVFLELGGYAGDETASGDDMMLLKKIQRAYPVEVSFLKSADALVWTGPKESLGGFLQQRKRWASKFKRLGFGPVAAPWSAPVCPLPFI
jgi:cellulose synthase/poly-beta-1,6-N-acetylglucosamine synthase-like glycosyltransferase